MTLLDNEELQRLVDYSFGDHSGVLGGVPNAFMKKANSKNEEFRLEVIHHMAADVKVMTLFIDNIRLYRRPLEYSDWLHMKPISEPDKRWLNQFKDEDLLQLCKENYPMKFIIFTAFEDTPLDDYIWEKIPKNVLAIHAANAVVFGKKVKPFPHGLERYMYEGYDHQNLLLDAIDMEVKPEKLLLVCHREDTGARGNLKAFFREKEWATTPPHLDYEPYLEAIQNHKFVLCPSGNGIESARNWETLYLKRVPVFKDHPYLRETFKNFPALFVQDYEQVTERLLRANNHLFRKAQLMNPLLLDLEYNYDIRCNATQ